MRIKTACFYEVPFEKSFHKIFKKNLIIKPLKVLELNFYPQFKNLLSNPKQNLKSKSKLITGALRTRTFITLSFTKNISQYQKLRK